MNTVTLPSKVRENAGFKAEASFEVISYAEKIELIPLQPIENLEGIFQGIDTTIERD
jgi:bifunctional DNA-binding transcriptional regulator/antitoxin component of YhaV-PrlF toxin-antitoxin module